MEIYGELSMLGCKGLGEIETDLELSLSGLQ